VISVVLPTFNESDNLAPLLKELSDALRGRYEYEVVVVDDNSPDLTWRTAASLICMYRSRLIVVRRFGRRGLSSAVIDGVGFTRGEYIVVMDADLQHPPSTIPRMVEAAKKGYELVVASRYAPGGGVEGWSRLRLLISKGATLIARLMLLEARGISDPMSGFFLVNRNMLRRCRGLNPMGFKILLELLVKCSPSRVAEVPYTFRRRLRGRSKLGLRTMIDYVLHVLKLSEWRPLKFATVGALGYVVNVLTTAVASIIAPWFYLRNVVGIEVSTLFNFTLHEHWTFKSRRGGSLLRRLASFHGAVVPAIIAQYVVAQLCYYLANLPEYLAILLGVIAGFTINYVLSEVGVWTQRST